MVPAMVADLREAAVLRVIGFYTAEVRNPNSRTAYAVAVRGFFR
jgi:nucleoside-triphosphatase THEP1